MPKKTNNESLTVPEKPVAMSIVDDGAVSIATDLETSHQMLGAAKYASYLNAQTKSDLVRFLRIVRDENRSADYGFANFDEFLNSPLSPMSQGSFYREEKLFVAEGEQYDLFNEWKIPARVRKQLSSGDIVLDGDEVVIAGSERVSLTNSGSIKAILEQLVKEKISAEKTAAEATEKLDRTERRLKAEQLTVDDLRAELQSIQDKTPFQHAFADLFEAATTLGDFVKYELDPDDRERRAEADCKALDIVLGEIKEAYGIAKWQEMMKAADAKAAKAGGDK